MPSKALATEILIFALFALSFNIVLGYTGLLSFGHAAFFGLGAYGTSLSLIHFNISAWGAILVGIFLATLIAALIGFLCLRLHGISFAFLTLAFAELIFFIFFHWQSLTGGDDGLSGIPIAEVEIPGIFSFSLRSSLNQYYFILFIIVISYFLIQRILHSPFGKVLHAIRENQERASFLGFNVSWYRLISFSISGLFSGLAGSLYAFYLNFVPIESLHWSMSGHIVITALIGGIGYFFGPALGAFIVLLLEDIVSTWIQRWELILGIFFVLVVIFLPEGVYSIPDKIKEYWHRSKLKNPS